MNKVDKIDIIQDLENRIEGLVSSIVWAKRKYKNLHLTEEQREKALEDLIDFQASKKTLTNILNEYLK